MIVIGNYYATASFFGQSRAALILRDFKSIGTFTVFRLIFIRQISLNFIVFCRFFNDIELRSISAFQSLTGFSAGLDEPCGWFFVILLGSIFIRWGQDLLLIVIEIVVKQIFTFESLYGSFIRHYHIWE